MRVGGLNWVSTRLYPLVKAACPDHPLLRETRREVLDDLLDAPGGRRWLATRPAVRFRVLPALSPFAAAWIEPGEPRALQFESPADALRRLHARLTALARARGRMTTERASVSDSPLPLVGRVAARARGGGDPPGRAHGGGRRRPPRLRMGSRIGGRLRPRPFAGRDAGEARSAARAGADRPAGRRGRPRRVGPTLPANRRGAGATGTVVAARDVRLEVLSGNHDRGLGSLTSHGFIQSGGIAAIDSRRELSGWTIAHGHLPIPARRLITGHHHPVLRLSSHSAPCFLAGESRIILPAFSENAAGLDISTGRVPPAWRRLALRAFVSTGADVLDFGPLESLSFRLASALSRSSVLPGNTHRLTHSNLDRTVEQA